DTLVLDASALNASSEAMAASPISDETINLSKEEEKETSKPKKKRRWWRLLLPIILVVVFVAYLLSKPVQVIIPKELVALDHEEAVKILEENSLRSEERRVGKG